MKTRQADHHWSRLKSNGSRASAMFGLVSEILGEEFEPPFVVIRFPPLAVVIFYNSLYFLAPSVTAILCLIVLAKIKTLRNVPNNEETIIPTKKMYKLPLT